VPALRKGEAKVLPSIPPRRKKTVPDIVSPEAQRKTGGSSAPQAARADREGRNLVHSPPSSA